MEAASGVWSRDSGARNRDADLSDLHHRGRGSPADIRLAYPLPVTAFSRKPSLSLFKWRSSPHSTFLPTLVRHLADSALIYNYLYIRLTWPTRWTAHSVGTQAS